MKNAIHMPNLGSNVAWVDGKGFFEWEDGTLLVTAIHEGVVIKPS
jgi:hypothetical protein